jgi:CheY-like chemotaxis protein
MMPPTSAGNVLRGASRDRRIFGEYTMSTQLRRILVVEDNVVLSDVLTFNLQAAGYDVTHAGDGEEAIQLLRSHSYDLMMTDLQMPRMDGEQLCRYVRQDPELCHLPIVMCSAKGMEVDMESLCLELKINKLVYKPFSMREVVAGVGELLAATALTS